MPPDLRLPDAMLAVPPFVGRTRELELLRSSLGRAGAGERLVILLVGDAGAGKTRVLGEFARYAAASGGRVLRGAGDVVAPTPFRPFRQALDRLAEQEAAAAGAAPPAIDLRPEAAGAGGRLAADHDTERYRRFEAVDERLAAASAAAPVVLLLDDLHWADEPSLQLLRHLARSTRNGRLLIVAALRDATGDGPSPLLEALADLVRAGARRVALGELSGVEVAEFVRRAAPAAGATGGVELAADLHELTGGNAFLLVELWRSLVAGGGLVADQGRLRLRRAAADVTTPASVRDVVRQRLASLPADARGILELAAVIGPRFTAEALERTADAPEAEAGDAVATCIAAGFVVERGAGHGFEFGHELVRRAVYVGIPPARRARLHARVGGWLMDRPAGTTPQAVIAHHLTAAGAQVDTGLAAAAHRRAAREDAGSLAFDAAARHLTAALELGIADPLDRIDALTELGAARVAAGADGDALAAYERAAALAREAGEPLRFARAAVGFEAVTARRGTHDTSARDLLTAANALVPAGDAEARVAVLAALARTTGLRGDPVTAHHRLGEAIAMARRIGDRRGLATALGYAYAGRGCTPDDDILDRLGEARELAVELGDLELLLTVRGWQVVMLVGLGRLTDADAELADQARLMAESRQPYLRFASEADRTTVALALGRLADAAAHLAASERWGQLLRGGDTATVHAIQTFEIYRAGGRLAEVEAPLRALIGGGALSTPWLPALAVLLAELGDAAAARAALQRIGDDLGEVRAGPLGPVSVLYLADAAAAVDDGRIAQLTYDTLEPRAGTVASFAGSVAFFGSTDRYLGKLAATLGRYTAAARHLERAAEQEAAMGARTWLAWTRYEQVRLDRRRGCAEDGAGAARRGAAAGGADRHDRAGAAAGGDRGRRRRARRPAVGARARRRSRRRPRPLEPGDRPGAVHVPAHGGRPRPQHSAQDRLREPDPDRRLGPADGPCGRLGRPVASARAAVRDRTTLRRGAADHRRGRARRRGREPRRRRPLALLVPDRRRAQDVLPVRGAVGRRDPGGGPAGGAAGGRDRRGDAVLRGWLRGRHRRRVAACRRASGDRSAQSAGMKAASAASTSAAARSPDRTAPSM